MKICNLNFSGEIPFRNIFVLLLIFFASSCVTNKKVSYLQENDRSIYSGKDFTPESYVIQPNDNLFIRVTTPDPRWSEMFNTLPVGSSTVSATAQSVDLLSYAVKLDGTVEIPYLGSIHVAGKTIAEAKELLEKHLADYVSDAAISVKLVNNYISIIGEVRAPGRYPIYKEQMNIFQAIAMAGDIADYGNRYKVKIVRQGKDDVDIKEFDMTDKNIIESEYYTVMPNDIIYVEPMKGKFFAMNQFPFALILSTITTFVLVMNYIE